MKKEKVQTFLDGYYLMVIKDITGRFGNNTSEVVRNIVQDWINTNAEKIERFKKEKEEAIRRGYVDEQ